MLAGIDPRAKADLPARNVKQNLGLGSASGTLNGFRAVSASGARAKIILDIRTAG